MIEMITQLKIGPDERVTKFSSDEAHSRDEANHSRCTDVELSSLEPENRELAMEQNQKIKGCIALLKIN